MKKLLFEYELKSFEHYFDVKKNTRETTAIVITKKRN